MARKKQENQTKDLLTTAILSLGIVWMVYLIFTIFHKEEYARTSAGSTQIELSELQERKGILSNNLAEIATPRGEEAIIRETYEVARPGEDVIIVLPPKPVPLPPPISAWQKFLNVLGI